jgi:hypothetical protein
MRQAVLRIHDLSPDGVRIVVDWESMQVSDSVFIPCVNTENANKQIARVVRDLEWKHTTRISVENSKLGVRIWRIA